MVDGDTFWFRGEKIRIDREGVGHAEALHDDDDCGLDRIVKSGRNRLSEYSRCAFALCLTLSRLG